MSSKIELLIQQRRRHQKITYKLDANNSSFRNIYNPYMQCRKYTLDPSLRPMLDFTVRISTNLKILFLGDSVSVMTAQMFQEQAQASERTVIRYSWGTTEGTHVARVDGGGIVAGWRITGWMVPKGKTYQDFPNIPGGRWMASDVPILMNETRRLYNDDGDNNHENNIHGHHDVSNNNNNNNNNNNITTPPIAFDAMVLRIPHGWMRLDEITRDALIQSLVTAHENFGFQTTIITTLPFVNNIQNQDDLQQLKNINTMIRDFAANYQANDIAGIHTIVTLDFDILIDQIVQHNGRLLGYNETTEIATSEYLFDQCCPAKKIMRSIPVICVSRQQCQPGSNGFTMDGMHWCNEAMNGRLGGGISCLLSCVYEQANYSLECAKKCNERFMHLAVMKGLRDGDDDQSSVAG